jgi:hypothetical protein
MTSSARTDPSFAPAQNARFLKRRSLGAVDQPQAALPGSTSPANDENTCAKYNCFSDIAPPFAAKVHDGSCARQRFDDTLDA